MVLGQLSGVHVIMKPGQMCRMRQVAGDGSPPINCTSLNEGDCTHATFSTKLLRLSLCSVVDNDIRMTPLTEDFLGLNDLGDHEPILGHLLLEQRDRLHVAHLVP